MNDATQFFDTTASGGYAIERSIRLNSSDSAYLARTPSVAGNRKTWTWAGWVKRGEISVYQAPVSAGISGSTPRTYLRFDNTDAIRLQNDAGFLYVTSSVYRDPAAWLHLVWVVDTTNATTADRVKLYVNGVRVTAFSTATTAAPNEDTLFNSTSHTAYIGVENRLTYYFSGYLADIHFIDGQALDPSSFGDFDTNGIWQPKAYTGTYGTNGFHLDFADNSTAAALGTDTSGNGNTWTVNNISVAAGADNDSLVDTPTSYGTDTGAGGEVRGNYCTWNPLDKDPDVSLANGNLDMSQSSGGIVRATVGVSSGKWYWEVVAGTGNTVIGACDKNASLADYVGSSANAVGWAQIGWAFATGVTFSGSLPTYTSGDLIGVALNMDSGILSYYKNGVLQSGTFSGLTGTWFPAIGTNVSATTSVANFGQRPFAYTAPSGFKALCTANLPSTTITTSGSYTGNGVADGPFIYLNGVPTAMTVNGNSVTFGTNADKLSNGFKIRTTSPTYNQNASTYNYSITSTGDPFKTARAQSNP